MRAGCILRTWFGRVRRSATSAELFENAVDHRELTTERDPETKVRTDISPNQRTTG